MHRYLILLLLAFFTVFSCQSDFDLSPEKDLRVESIDDKIYKLRTDKEIKDFIKLSIGDKSAKIEEPLIEEVSNDLGNYFLVKGKYFDSESKKSVTIVLVESENKSPQINQGDDIVLLSTSCTMTCTPEPVCMDGCSQTIIRPCQAQSCDCTRGGIGGCSSSISYGDPEE